MSIYTKVIDLQKLNDAWQRVKKNKPAAGVDHITWEQFDENRQDFLKELNGELKNHTYTARPVKTVTLYRGEKARVIALYSMRDKVVQQSLAMELNKLYEGAFSKGTYAYRSDQSALNAVRDINEQITNGEFTHLLKLDIRHFFDEIRWDILQKTLRKRISEEDVLTLIRENTCSIRLDEETGELVPKRVGIYQGSAISPVLSNIYLAGFDAWMTSNTDFFARYADDIMILGKDKASLMNLLTLSASQLESLGLSLNESKSICTALEEGTDFLGYHFDVGGKAIPAKAKENLQERLESMWLISADIDFDDKVKKAIEISGGWEQYYREERELCSIIEYASLLRVSLRNEEKMKQLQALRPSLENVFRDIMLFLAGKWAERRCPENELLEYEQYYQVPRTGKVHEISGELLANYRAFVVLETPESALEIMQCYTDLGAYEKAAFWQQKKEQLDYRAHIVPADILPGRGGDTMLPVITNATPAKMLKAFAGREDIFCREVFSPEKKRISSLCALPLTEQVIREHLKGNKTIGTYIQRPNATVRFMIIDIDISKRVFLQTNRDSKQFDAYLKKALDKAAEVCDLLQQMGLKGHIEYSGSRGYHVWIFLTEWMPVRYANLFFEVIEAKIQTDDDISMEFFPNKTRLKQGKYGQTIKLPYGMHLTSGERSYFLDESYQPVFEINQLTDRLSQFSIGAIKKVLAMHSGIKEREEPRVVDQDLSMFGTIDDSVSEVLSKCNLIRYLCQKSAKTGFLSHFERLTVLYVMGHMGENGAKFVHQVMSFTLNYSYNTTDRFIRKRPDKPISCIKLRDQYKKVTAEIGCNCVFKRVKNCYPSPVLHAIVRSNNMNNDITLPTSKTLTKEKEKSVMEQMNIHKKAEALAKQILQFKKERRSIDQQIRKIESELKELFDQAAVDSLELEMGLLVRRKTEHGDEWVIEI